MNRSSHPAKAARQARAPFTLPELLTVITILCVLAALLLPALGRAKFSARVALCVGHLSQCGQMTFLYASDNSGKLYDAYIDRPTVIFWDGAAQRAANYADLRQTLLDYAQTNRVLFCPASQWPPPPEGKFLEMDNPANSGDTEYRIGYALWAGLRDTPMAGYSAWYTSAAQTQSYNFARTTADPDPETKPLFTDDAATWPFLRAEWGGPYGNPNEPYADWSSHVWGGRVDSVNGVFLDGHVSVAKPPYKRQVWRDHVGHANDWDGWFFW